MRSFTGGRSTRVGCSGCYVAGIEPTGRVIHRTDRAQVKQVRSMAIVSTGSSAGATNARATSGVEGGPVRSAVSSRRNSTRHMRTRELALPPSSSPSWRQPTTTRLHDRT
uniref:Uncharacterized protein n=1 Tax=Plectus sambesii TaxID=2011161 RepID=A0A914VR96_9BILA